MLIDFEIDGDPWESYRTRARQAYYEPDESEGAQAPIE